MNATYYFSDLWPYVSEHLCEIEESARRCSAVKRCRNVTPAALLRMALAYATSDFSLKDVAAWARALEIAQISGPGLHYRIKNSESWFQALLTQVLETTATVPGTGFTLRIVDATVITGPGSKGIGWRAHVSLDPDTGRIQSVEVTDTQGGESFCRYTSSPNVLEMGDRGYCAARGIYSRVAGGGHVLVRVNHHSIRVCDLNKKMISLSSYFQSIEEGQSKQWDVLIPVPADQVKKYWTLKHAKAWVKGRIIAFRRDGQIYSFFTDLATDKLSALQAQSLYRVRWQIELAFKRLKSQLDLDELRTRNGPTARSWILLKFLAAALAQKILSPNEPFFPGGSVC
jgi:Transposase DDE domain